MRSTSNITKRRAVPFGLIADVLFHIIINGDASTVLRLCLLNRATYETIKLLEPHICGWFMRLQGIDAFNPILTLNPWTGKQTALTVHTLSRFLQRQEIARNLSLHIVPSVWGPFHEDGDPEMNFEAELKLAKRLERGLLVLFHMADISHDMKRQRQSKKPLHSLVPKRLVIITKMLDEYREFPLHKQQFMPFDEYTRHVYKVLKWGYDEAEIGRKRLNLRSYLEDQTQIDFHCTMRMLRELTERMLLRHGPKDWHRDTRDEYSVISWFILQQSPRNLAKLFLGPQNECCYFDGRSTGQGPRKCCFSDPLDGYWEAWRNIPNLGCLQCDCKKRVRSWSVKPAIIDARGQEFNRAAEKYLKEMWSQRHVGLHRALTMGFFATLL